MDRFVDPFWGQVELFPHRLHDPDIGLMGDDPADVLVIKARFFQAFLGGPGHAADSLLEDLLAGHFEVVESAAKRLFRSRMSGASAGDDDQLGEFAVGAKAYAIDRQPVPFAGDDYGRSPIAEKDAGRPVFVIHEGGHLFRSDQQDIRISARFDKRLGSR